MNKINNKTNRLAFLAFILAGLCFLGIPAAFADGGTVTGDKTVNPIDIPCNGSTTVTLTLNGETGISGDPEDIMLVIDTSGSLPQADIDAIKSASKMFVDMLDEADGSADGTISGGSQMGIVSFAAGSSLNHGLSTNTASLKAAIDALPTLPSTATDMAGGLTKAQAELLGTNGIPTNTKDMIVFSDGKWNTGLNPIPIANAAKASGTEIFSIAYGPSPSMVIMNAIATSTDHVYLAPDSTKLEEIFEKIGSSIVAPAGTNIMVVDDVNSHFSVTAVSVDKGTVSVSGNVITWTIRELMTETAIMTYTATHDNTQAGGTKAVNDLVTYIDDEGKTVTFLDPTVNVRGCAANLVLDPKTATNELGTFGQTHTVTATVTDDFNAPVANILVNFNILLGPNSGMFDFSNTDGIGEAKFTYTATQGLLGLGMDDIIAFVPMQPNVYRALEDQATKEWVDTTPPTAACVETVNPAGKNVPKAKNEDGFYGLFAKDHVDPNPQVFVMDTGSGTVFGPYAIGTKIKYTQAPGAKPSASNLIGGPKSAIDWHIKGTGDAAIYAVDASGNVGTTMMCLVAPPPK
ncbi:MAG: VWA domain-containing protein [Candidatus Aenigmarchaeota archaeon]|nr:VWA domain-containing protein [Candidatus Aenigmarchaeota archaeon]